MRPMSWYCGSHETHVGEWSSVLHALWMTFRWLTIAPLGSLVEPDVYWRNRLESGSSRKSWRATPRTLSVVTQSKSPVGMGFWNGAVSLRRALRNRNERKKPRDVSAAFARQLFATKASFS